MMDTALDKGVQPRDRSQKPSSAASCDGSTDASSTDSTRSSVIRSGISGQHVQDLIRRQMQVSRALSDQEETSFQLIQALLQLQETVQVQEQEIQQLQEQPNNNQEWETLCEEQAAELEALAQANDESNLLISNLQREALHQSLELQQLKQQVDSLTRACKAKDAAIRDRDSVIAVFAQKIALLEAVPPKQVQRMVTQPAVVHHPNVSASNQSSTLKERKAAREQRLQEILGRLRPCPSTPPPAVSFLESTPDTPMTVESGLRTPPQCDMLYATAPAF